MWRLWEDLGRGEVCSVYFGSSEKDGFRRGGFGVGWLVELGVGVRIGG